MANDIATVIPRYIDKSVYYVTLDDKTGNYNSGSYTVKSTYKGILRLSPNNGNSLVEDTQVQITDTTTESLTDYKDSLNEFLDDASGSGRLVRLSTSDGFFTDMRLNTHDIEFDNLYVESILSGKTVNENGENIEPFKHNNTNTLLLFTKFGDDEAFNLGSNTSMPVYANESNYSGGDKEPDPYNVIQPVNFKSGISDSDGSEENQFDNSAILFARNVNGKRIFEYKNSSELIKELVQEALMSFHTVPTGSIHFVPLDIDDYKNLIGCKSDEGKGEDKSLPNKILKGGVNDPIVRDFLLCDGRKYWIKDFPELAKILEGETITYERIVSLGDGNNVWRRFTYVNKYDKDHKWFRVPDLRHKFIKSPYLSFDEINDETNNTGIWAPDNLPTIPQGKESDRHYHFLALPEYNADSSKTDFISSLSSGSSSVGMVLNGISSSMPPGGTQYDMFTTCNASGRCANGKENHTPAVHFLTQPINVTDENYKNKEFIPDSGLTSDNIIDKTIPSESKHLGFGVYKDRYNDFETTDMTNGNRYGMENNPEFYACVPLIRI